ncbi:YhdP family protein [Noviherbaspirillum humi]|uniref:YhdP family protein n=1 Tax=Noviherbaspirillum humi TaxID=1688639 RepID=UPI001FE5997D|nr:YhdP family protein [Noviherbaspirillum humi]
MNAVTRHGLSLALKLAVVIYFLFCLLFLVLRYALLPSVGNYKGHIEQAASRAIGNPVTISAIDASWNGLLPRLELDEVAVHDRAGREALRLPKVTATVSWLSVLVGDLRLHTLEIDRPDMDVMRDAEGRLYVAGILIDSNRKEDSRGADWVLSQREIVVRGGRLRWNDRKREVPELLLQDVTMVLRNHWRSHQFALKATPPAQIAAPLDVRAQFVHPPFSRNFSDPAAWRGELYADLRDGDLAAWKPYLDSPVEVNGGRGSVRAWIEFDHARLANLTADLSLADLSTRLAADLDMLNLKQVRGRISVREEIARTDAGAEPGFGRHGHAITLTDFSMESEDGLTLPTTTISESHVPAKKGKPEQTEFSARLLDLKTVADFALRLPLSPQQRQMLADFAPRGVLRDFSLSWQGSYPNPVAYAVKGQFEGLSMQPQAAKPARPASGKSPAQAAVPAIPGFDNLSGRIDASEKGGQLALASQDLTLELGAWLPQAVLPLNALGMQAGWSFPSKDKLLLDVQKLEFRRDGLSGSLSGKHLMPLHAQGGKAPGVIDMQGRVSGLALERLGQYLPLSLPEGLRQWLSAALIGGTAEDVRLRLRGDLAQFPFRSAAAGDKSRGEFSVHGRIVDGKLDYGGGRTGKDGKAPLWPVIEKIDGTISFDRARMEIHAASAQTHGVTLSNVKAVIPELGGRDMALLVDGDAGGPLQEFVAFVNDSPVGEWIAHFTEETRATGNARLGLKLQMPLGRLPETRVQGALQFAGNNITLQNLIPMLGAASGKLEFHEKGFNLANVKATFLGGPVAVAGGMQRDGSIQIRADGTMSSDGLRKTYPSPAAQRLADRISGSTRYSAVIRVKNKRPEIIVDSSLAGLELDFPSPLRKAATEIMPLHVEMAGLPGGEGSLQRDEIRLTLGGGIAARYERQKAADRNAEWQVVRGGIGVNAPPPQPDSGLVANVSLRSLNVDAWGKTVSAILEPARTSEANAAAPAPATGGDQPNLSQYVDPDVMAARATEMIIMGKKLDNVVVGASHVKGTWQANINSDQASGYLTWNQGPAGQGMGRVTARLASLVIPKEAATEVSDLLEGKNTTTQIPALDVVAENFELLGKKFGRVELNANNVRVGGANEWRIGKLSITNPDAEFRATGKWVSRDGDSTSSLNYSLNMADAGRLLERFGFANVLRGGKGKIEGELAWKGLPFSFDIPTLSGNITLDVAAGQFLKVDPAAAKLLGVLSLQALPRRLVLDFRDVFSEGFAFDGVTAAASIDHGVARTSNFKMRGVAATVLIDGMADIDQETQNLRVVVIPEINVGTASVVYALAVNPVIGVGSFLAQLFLRDPLAKAFTFEYGITGPWKEPVVTKLPRRQTAPNNDANAGNDKTG